MEWNLDLLEEKREEAKVRAAAYKRRTVEFFNKKFKHQVFKVEDLVLREVEMATRRKEDGKLRPNFEGSYAVVANNRPDSYQLEDNEWKEAATPLEFRAPKKIYYLPISCNFNME